MNIKNIPFINMGIKATKLLIKLIQLFYRIFLNKKYTSMVIAAITIIVGVSLFFSSQSTSTNLNVIPTNLIGSFIPSFQYSKLDDKQIFKTSDPSNDKLVLIFWNSNSIESKYLLNSLSKNTEVINKNIKLIAINSDEDELFARYYIHANNFDLQNTNYVFTSKDIAISLNKVKTPQIYFVSKQKIEYVDVYIQNASALQSRVIDFANGYKNNNTTNYSFGSRLTIDPAKVHTACNSTIQDFSSFSNLPSSTQPANDKGFTCIPIVDNNLFNDFNKSLYPNIKLIKVTIGITTHLYPLNYLANQIIVNDLVSGIPITIFFDPLSYTTHVFESTINGKYSTFGFSGREYENSLLIYDSSTYSLWYNDTSVYGSEAGKSLNEIPYTFINSNDFELNNAQILLTDGATASSFEDYWNNDKYIYPSDFKATKENKEIITVIPESAVKFGNEIFSQKLGDQSLTFIPSGEYFKDNETSSLWNIFGECVNGTLRGAILERAIIKTGMRFNLSPI